jgi:hypothetical protein
MPFSFHNINQRRENRNRNFFLLIGLAVCTGKRAQRKTDRPRKPISHSKSTVSSTIFFPFHVDYFHDRNLQRVKKNSNFELL